MIMDKLKYSLKFNDATPTDVPGDWNANATLSFSCKGDRHFVNRIMKAVYKAMADEKKE